MFVFHFLCMSSVNENGDPIAEGATCVWCYLESKVSNYRARRISPKIGLDPLSKNSILWCVYTISETDNVHGLLRSGKVCPNGTVDNVQATFQRSPQNPLPEQNLQV